MAQGSLIINNVTQEVAGTRPLLQHQSVRGEEISAPGGATRGGRGGRGAQAGPGPRKSMAIPVSLRNTVAGSYAILVIKGYRHESQRSRTRPAYDSFPSKFTSPCLYPYIKLSITNQRLVGYLTSAAERSVRSGSRLPVQRGQSHLRHRICHSGIDER